MSSWGFTPSTTLAVATCKRKRPRLFVTPPGKNRWRSSCKADLHAHHNSLSLCMANHCEQQAEILHKGLQLLLFRLSWPRNYSASKFIGYLFGCEGYSSPNSSAPQLPFPAHSSWGRQFLVSAAAAPAMRPAAPHEVAPALTRRCAPSPCTPREWSAQYTPHVSAFCRAPCSPSGVLEHAPMSMTSHTMVSQSRARCTAPRQQCYAQRDAQARS